jgi:hypothetical protein
MTRKNDHIKIENTSTGGYRMFCDYCGRDHLIVPPIPMDMFHAIGRQFAKEHRNCRPQSGELK